MSSSSSSDESVTSLASRAPRPGAGVWTSGPIREWLLSEISGLAREGVVQTAWGLLYMIKPIRTQRDARCFDHWHEAGGSVMKGKSCRQSPFVLGRGTVRRPNV